MFVELGAGRFDLDARFDRIKRLRFAQTRAIIIADLVARDSHHPRFQRCPSPVGVKTLAGRKKNILEDILGSIDLWRQPEMDVALHGVSNAWQELHGSPQIQQPLTRAICTPLTRVWAHVHKRERFEGATGIAVIYYLLQRGPTAGVPSQPNVPGE